LKGFRSELLNFIAELQNGQPPSAFVALKDDEAELYDPDDPNSDWGQAVQEALQERHLLVQFPCDGATLRDLP
jgi:hypothetical protein